MQDTTSDPKRRWSYSMDELLNPTLFMQMKLLITVLNPVLVQLIYVSSEEPCVLFY